MEERSLKTTVVNEDGKRWKPVHNKELNWFYANRRIRNKRVAELQESVDKLWKVVNILRKTSFNNSQRSIDADVRQQELINSTIEMISDLQTTSIHTQIQVGRNDRRLDLLESGSTDNEKFGVPFHVSALNDENLIPGDKVDTNVESEDLIGDENSEQSACSEEVVMSCDDEGDDTTTWRVQHEVLPSVAVSLQRNSPVQELDQFLNWGRQVREIRGVGEVYSVADNDEFRRLVAMEAEVIGVRDGQRLSELWGEYVCDLYEVRPDCDSVSIHTFDGT